MPTPVVRRRLAVAAVAAAALAGGLLAGASGGTEAPQRGRLATTPGDGQAPAEPQAPVDALTPAQRAGTTIVLRFAGTQPPGYVLDALRRRLVAGVILFGDNLTTPAGLRRMTRRLQRAARGRALIMVDQEGGDVRIVPWAGPADGQAHRTAQDAQPVARAAGRQLRRLGVNVVLAPVADAARAGTALASRAFTGDVAALTAATVRGFEEGGVLPTAKHFPGLGAAQTNTDLGPATVDASRAELEATDLPPFAAAIAAGVPLIMASHAHYPALDPVRPASQSRPILTGLLRRRMGFRGVIITDSLEAAAVTSEAPTPVAAARAISAGADLLLTTGRGSYTPVLRKLEARQRRHPRFRHRLRAAAARVLALQGRLNGT